MRDKPSEPTEAAVVTYTIQVLVAAENSISGVEFWADVELPDGKTQTADLEYAKAHLDSSGINGAVRLIKITKEIIG